MTILHGDCREQLATLPDASIDAIVTDPPYELGFMGKKWDASGIAYDPTVWAECLRVLKPGGHLLAFGGTRTYHRMTVAIEDAGFEIRDSLHWLYGSGFPKSLDVSKAIDKAAGAAREVIGTHVQSRQTRKEGVTYGGPTSLGWQHDLTAPATPAAAAAGWGTALKPAHEPIVLARKPLVGTVAANVMAYGTGALNIDACRVAGALEGDPMRFAKTDGGSFASFSAPPIVRSNGRWPANLMLTHSPDCATECVSGCPVAALNTQSGNLHPPGTRSKRNDHHPFKNGSANLTPDTAVINDRGGASRFFTTTEWHPQIDVPFLYVAKPSRRERNAGLDGMPERSGGTLSGGEFVSDGRTASKNGTSPTANHHPTVKPVALMRHLVRLVTPPGGTVLDPFLGSGTTAVAATLEGFAWIGCELTDDYLPIIQARVAWAEQNRPEPDLTLFTEQP